MARPGSGSIPDPPDVASVLSHLEFAAQESNWPLNQDFDAFLAEVIRATNVFDSIRSSIIRHLASNGVDPKTLVTRPDIHGQGLPVLDALDLVRSCWVLGLTDEQTEIVTGITPDEQQEAHAHGRLGLQRHARLREILNLRAAGNHNIAIATALGLNQSYVARTLRRCGLKPFPAEYLVEQNVRRDEIIALWNEGYTSAYIAHKMKSTDGAIRNVVARTRQRGEVFVREGRKPVEQPGVRVIDKAFGRYAKKDDGE